MTGPRVLELAPGGRARADRSDPLWFRVLDRFGLPTLFVLIVLAFGWRQLEADRAERRELVGLLGALRTTLADLAASERAHADAVTATWPQVRIARGASRNPQSPSEAP